MNDDDAQQRNSTRGKQRRNSDRQTNRKNISIRLTESEHRFFSDASNLLGETLAVIFRAGAKRYVEEKTDLRQEDYDSSDGD